MSKPRMAVLISGTGRNMQAILQACRDNQIQAEPCLVVSNRPNASGLHKAQELGVPTLVIDHKDFQTREAFDQQVAQVIQDSGAEIIVLAGFMRILSGEFIQQFEGRLFNIHPSLLPKYRGLHTHRRALEAGDTYHGASVHYVTEELDAGAVIKQGRIRIAPGDDEDALASRVMNEVELSLYPEVLSWVAAGRVCLKNGQAWLDDKPLTNPVIGDYA